MGLLTQFSWWYLPGCLLLGLLFAWLQYRRYVSDQLQKAPAFGLAVLRGLSVALLALLLLNPYLRTDKKIVEKPVLVLAFDNSASLLQADSNALRNKMQALQTAITDQLGEAVDLRSFGFGAELSDTVSFDFGEKATDYSRVFETLLQRYSGKRVAGVVLATDGIQNRGYDPLSLIEKWGTPIYAWPLGDTSLKRDLRIRAVRANNRVFINNDFGVQIDLEINKLNGRQAQITLESVEPGGNKVLASQTVNVNRDRFYTTLSMVAQAGKEAGLRKYRLRASIADEDNNSTANNSRDFYTEVMDMRTRILLVAHAPHPDLGLIRQAIQDNPQYELVLRYATQGVNIDGKFDLAILHQLPSTATFSAAWLQSIQQLGLPRWFMVGSQTTLPALQQAQQTVQIQARAGSANKVLPGLKADFGLFQTPETWETAMMQLPPLDVPFADYQLKVQGSALLQQRIGQLTTDMPLLAYNALSQPREALLLGEGLWRWQLASAEQRQNSAVAAEVVGKSLQFLAITESKDPFVVRTSKNLYQEQDDIYFEATLRNDSREAVNDADVRIEIKNEQNQRFSYVMGRSNKNYLLNAGALPPGNYSWQAEVNFSGKRLTQQGAFAVAALDLEQNDRVANHRILAQWSALSGGRMLPGENPIDSLLPWLQASQATTPTSYYESRLRELISLEWLLGLIALLLSFEWVLRRYWGLR